MIKCEKCQKEYPSQYYFAVDSICTDCYEKLSPEEKGQSKNEDGLLQNEHSDGKEQIVLPDDPIIHRAVFEIIEKYGPKNELELAKLELTKESKIAIMVKCLLLSFAVVIIGLIVLFLMIVLHELASKTFYTFLFGASMALFAFLCPFITARIIFQPPNLLNSFRREVFKSNWQIGAPVGFITGFLLCFLISETPGYLPSNFRLVAIIVISFAAVLGQLVGVFGMLRREQSNAEMCLEWIKVWEKEKS